MLTSIHPHWLPVHPQAHLCYVLQSACILRLDKNHNRLHTPLVPTTVHPIGHLCIL